MCRGVAAAEQAAMVTLGSSIRSKTCIIRACSSTFQVFGQALIFVGALEMQLPWEMPCFCQSPMLSLHHRQSIYILNSFRRDFPFPFPFVFSLDKSP